MTDIQDMTPDELRERAQHLVCESHGLRAGARLATWQASLATALFALADYREKQAIPPVYDESEHFWTGRTRGVNGIVCISCQCGAWFFDRGALSADEQHCRHRQDMHKAWEAEKLTIDPDIKVPRLLHHHRNRRWLDKTGDVWFFRDNYWLYTSHRTGRTSKCFSSIPECGPFAMMVETSQETT